MKRFTPVVLVALVLLVSCSDDANGTKPDAAVVLDAAVIVSDAKEGQDLAQQDSVVTPDAPWVDGLIPRVLDNQHTGWKQAKCGGCHSLPAKFHTETEPFQCAACHGGNGACDPNSSGSPKQDHDKTLPCTTCHIVKHDFTDSAACVACHFAAADTLDCPAL